MSRYFEIKGRFATKHSISNSTPVNNPEQDFRKQGARFRFEHSASPEEIEHCLHCTRSANACKGDCRL